MAGVCGPGNQPGACITPNHPDAQIFTPPYLFNPDGEPCVRQGAGPPRSMSGLGLGLETLPAVRSIREPASCKQDPVRSRILCHVVVGEAGIT